MNLKAKGTHTTTEFLAQRLLQRWVPKWYEAFIDPQAGGVYERVGHSFKPVLTGQRRLLTHCRQLATYSDAVRHEAAKAFKPDLARLFGHIIDTYYVPETGGWRYSVDDGGAPLDNCYDLYTQAFVIFGFSHYFRATGDNRAKELAEKTLVFIDRYFRVDDLTGLVEALDADRKPLARPRRHESHMHLFEACLFAAEVWDGNVYDAMCAELAELFTGVFYDRSGRTLSEYYTDDLIPLAQNGHIIAEPGHYCEWIWLLKKYAAYKGHPDFYDDLCRTLLEWANRYGWDNAYGGIYDELDPQGNIVNDTKRIWPFSEALKANALMLDAKGIDKHFIKQRIFQMVGVFNEHYMQERGFWTEWLSRDLKPAVDYMPGTTPYHVYFGIMETREVLQARGQSKSLSAGVKIALYSMRRRISNGVKSLRTGLKKKRA